MNNPLSIYFQSMIFSKIPEFYYFFLPIQKKVNNKLSDSKVVTLFIYFYLSKYGGLRIMTHGMTVLISHESI